MAWREWWREAEGGAALLSAGAGRCDEAAKRGWVQVKLYASATPFVELQLFIAIVFYCAIEQ
jgi:hypothetical protein